MYEKNLTEDGRGKMLTLEMNGVCENKSKRNWSKALFFDKFVSHIVQATNSGFVVHT